MRTGILHISDIHFRKNDYNLVNTLNIEKVLSHYENIEKIVIVISGDIANSCKREEYLCANTFIGFLTKKFKIAGIKDIEIIVIPGNHDILLSKEGRNINDIREYYESGEIESKLEDELCSQENFYKFSSKYKCFERKGLIDVKDINVGTNTIRFVLINTAPFSTFSDKVHNDKDVHYCRDNIINQISHDGVDYIFVVMHHSYEWFEDESKSQLIDLIMNRSEVVLIGHEHNDEFIKATKDGKDICVSKCGEMNFEKCCGEFNVLVFDDTDAKFFIDKFKIKQGKTLSQEHMLKKTHLNTKKKLVINNGFLDKFYYDSVLRSKNFSKTFVFPVIFNNDENIIKNMNEMIESFYNNKISIIKAADRCGKTTIIKAIYKTCNDKKYYPLYIDIERIGNSNKNVKTIIINEIKKQYSVDAVNYYLQEDNNKKILLVDNINRLNKKTDKIKFLKLLLNYFDIVIATTSLLDWKNIKEEYKNSMVLGINEYSLKPLTYSKRNELVNTICKEYNCIDSIKIENTKKCIERIYNNKILVIGGTSDFLVRYIKRIVENESYNDGEYYDVYSGLFENDITDSLRDHVDRKNIDAYKTIYGQIAYEMHKRKESYMSIDRISVIINDYNEYFGKNIIIRSFIDNSIKAKIFIELGNLYSFSTKLQLAFFVAKSISSSMSSNKEDFIKCLNNICFGINDDIVMFVVYFTKNDGLLKLIYQETIKYFEEMKKIDFEKININYLKNQTTENEKIKISVEDNHKYKENIDKKEIERFENLEIRCDGIYEYNEEDIDNYENKLDKSYKLVGLTSKLIAISHTFVGVQERKEMLLKLSEFYSKFIFYALKELEEEYDDFIEDLVKSDIKENIKDENDRRKFFVNQFIRFIRYVIVSTLKELSVSISDENSRNLIGKLDRDINDRLFALSIMSNIHNVDQFIQYIDNYLLKNNLLVENLVLLIINDFSYKNDLTNNERDKLVSFLNTKLEISSKYSRLSFLKNSKKQ